MTITKLPRHVAIIMDGNGRWAKQRNLPRVMGHKEGVNAVRESVKKCVEKNIEVLTLFAFSSENWHRPASEVTYLMKLFIGALQREAKKLHKQNIRLRIIGDRSRFEEKLQQRMQKAEELTAKNTGLTLVVAANYGGQWDIVQALKQIATQIQDGTLSPQMITAELVQQHLCLSDLPLPDLFIRTSGEQRISNFMIWQLAYSELFFSDKLWPEFDGHEFDKALEAFAKRERRFGFTSEQLSDVQHA